MANLNYYAHEIDRQLRQVSVNEIDIGMRRVNVLPVPDGELTIEQSDLPSSADLTVIGDTANGSITVSLSGEAEVPPTITVLVGCGKLTPRGNGPGATGTLIPGTYSVTLGGSESAASMPWDEYKPPMLYINVGTSEGATSYSTDYDGETTDIVVPDNYTEVEFTLYLYIDSFDEAASCQLYPFLRLKALEDEPFEPYKPDLQTQINALPQAENVARLTDAVGTDGSINLFPIDKGKNGEPFEYERVNGVFYINSEGFFNIGEKIGRMAFEGTSDGTTEDVDEFRVFFNIGYKDTAYEFGDLVRGKYALSYEIDDDTDFTDNGEIYFEVYGFNTSTLLTTVHAGETKTFEVTEDNPKIEIKVVAHRFANHNWNGSAIIFTPYLRRAELADRDVDKYLPSLQKQIVLNDAKIRNDLQNYENSNNNYLMPTFSGELPVEVNGGVGGFCYDWAIHGNDNVGKNKLSLTNYTSSGSGNWTVDISEVTGEVILNGTATGSNGGQVLIEIVPTEEMRVYFSASPSGGSGSSYNAYMWDTTAGGRCKKWDGVTNSVTDLGNSQDNEAILPAGHSCRLICRIAQNYNAQNVVFKPMLRLPDTTSVFEPYQIGVGRRTKNLLVITEDTTTKYDVTFTVNLNDGSIVATGTCSSSSTKQAQFNIQGSSRLPISDGLLSDGMIISCDNLIAGTQFALVYYDTNESYISEQICNDTNSSQVISIPSNAVYYRFNVRKTATAGDTTVTFKPMLRAADTTADFIPYGYQVPLINCDPFASEELYDPADTNTANGYISDAYLDANGTAQTSSDFIVSEYYEFQFNKGLLTWRGVSGMGTAACICFYDGSKNFIGSQNCGEGRGFFFYPPENTVYIRASIEKAFKDSARIFAYPSFNYNVYVGPKPLRENDTVNQDSYSYEYSDISFALRAKASDSNWILHNEFDTPLYNKPACDFTVDRLRNIENSIIEANVVVNGYNETQVDRITDNVEEVTT